MRFKSILTVLFASLLMTSSLFAETTVSWWQFWTDPTIKPVIESIITDFEKQNPDIKIELTDLTWANGHEKIVISFASDNGPDLVELGSDWIAEFASNGLLWDLTDEIGSDSAGYQGWGMATYKDKVYAYPWFLGTRVLFGNKDLIKRAGYDEDFVPIKMKDLKEAAIKINGLSKNIYGRSYLRMTTVTVSCPRIKPFPPCSIIKTCTIPAVMSPINAGSRMLFLTVRSVLSFPVTGFSSGSKMKNVISI